MTKCQLDKDDSCRFFFRLILPEATILNFSSIFKKEIAHLHTVRNKLSRAPKKKVLKAFYISLAHDHVNVNVCNVIFLNLNNLLLQVIKRYGVDPSRSF